MDTSRKILTGESRIFFSTTLVVFILLVSFYVLNIQRKEFFPGSILRESQGGVVEQYPSDRYITLKEKSESETLDLSIKNIDTNFSYKVYVSAQKDKDIALTISDGKKALDLTEEVTVPFQKIFFKRIRQNQLSLHYELHRNERIKIFPVYFVPEVSLHNFYQAFRVYFLAYPMRGVIIIPFLLLMAGLLWVVNMKSQWMMSWHRLLKEFFYRYYGELRKKVMQRVSRETMFLLLVFLGWLVAVFVASYVAYLRIPDSLLTRYVAVSDSNVFRTAGNATVVYREGFLYSFLHHQWDSGFYDTIATRGYKYFIESDQGYNGLTFFPLYPLIVKGVNVLFRDITFSFFVVSSVCAFLSLYFLYRLGMLIFQNEERKVMLSRVSVIFLLSFPVSFYLISAYTESLFLLLTILSFYFAKKKQWAYAGLVAFVCGFSRPTGFLLVFPLLFEYLKDRKGSGTISGLFKRIDRNILYIGMIPMSLVVFSIYLYFITGDIAALSKAQVSFGRDFVLQDFGQVIFKTTLQLLRDFLKPDFFYSIQLMEVAGFWFFFISSLFIYKKIDQSLGIFACMLSLFPLLSNNVLSMNRYYFVIFPVYFLLAKTTLTRPALRYSILFLFLLLLGVFNTLFVNGYWVD